MKSKEIRRRKQHNFNRKKNIRNDIRNISVTEDRDE